MPERLSLPIGDIVVPADGRTQHDVTELAGSIRTLSLLHPLVVIRGEDGRFQLVAGRHRLAALAQLGWTEAPVVVVDLDALHAELATIDENLVRHQLTALEHTEQLARRKELYEALHPETRAGVAGGKGRQGSANDNLSFADDTAAKTGMSPRTIQRDVQTGRDLTEEAKAIVRGTPVENRKGDLREVASLPADQQAAAAAAKVNPPAPAEPRDVARARKAGIIPEGAKVTVDEPEDDSEDAPDVLAVESAPQTDAEWLATLPARSRLADLPRERFDRSALLFREISPHRLEYRKTCSPLIKASQRKSHHIDQYTTIHNRYLATRDPSEWVACNGCPDESGLSTGQIPLVGECGDCHGEGYHINGDWQPPAPPSLLPA